MTSQQSTTHTHIPSDSPGNVPWGDSINFKHQHTFRLYFQNINGIQLHLPEKWENIIKTSMEEMHSDIVGFCETCLNWKLPHIRKQLQQLNTKYLKTKINITHSNNRTHSTSSFLPGGTLLATKGHWTGRIQEHLHDPHHMGRWTGTKYILQQNRHLYVLSAYRACRNSSSPQNLANSNSTYAQQYYSLKEKGTDTPQPRKQFVEDIIQYIHALHLQPDDMLILLMDANEQIGMEQSGIANIITHGGLVDMFTMHNCSPVTIPTFINGKSRIDYILGTPNILPYIKQCGYLPFNSGIISDHRGLFLDLCSSIIDNKTTYNEAPIREIGRHSSMEQTTKYKQYIVNQFEYHNIASRAAKLYDRSQEKFTPNERKVFIAELNTIDKSITEIMLQADKKVGKDPLHQSVRSQQISELQKLLRYWQITVSGIKNEKDFSNVLQTLADKISPGIIEKMNERGRTPTTNLIKTKELLSQARKDQIQNWKEEAFAEIALIASAERISPITVQKTQRNTTNTRRIFAILRDRFKPRLSRGLTSLIVPDGQQNDNALYKTIHDQQEIENLLIARNIAHFGQAQGSPFTTSPIVDKIGYKGTNNFSAKIIRGDDISPELHNMTGGLKEIIKILNIGKHTPKFSINIDQEEFMSGFRKWREETATSPSGRHLGHYKALLRAEYHEINQAQIFKKLQDATEKWSELISASGGKLELQKCFFYAMIWKFTQEGEAILQTITQQQAIGNHVINITDPDTIIKVPVTQKSCNDAHKTLGVYKTTIGDDTRQFEELLTKSKNLALSVSTSKLTRQQGRLSYNMIYIPTITYCLRACTFSQAQLDKIQAPALYKFLPAMGWNRTSSRAIIHGPEELGGFNIPPLYAHQK